MDVVNSGLKKKLTVITNELLIFIALNVFLSTDNLAHLAIFVLFMAVVLWFIKKRSGLSQSIIRSFMDEWRIAVIFAAILAVIFPFCQVRSPYNIYLLAVAGIYIIMALGLDYMVGGTDLVNLGFAGFYAVGAYTSALLTTRLGWTFWSALPAAALAAMVFGLAVGLPALKTRGYYLSLVTIAFGLIVHTLLTNMQWLGGANGIKGIPEPRIGNYSFLQSIDVFGLKLPFEANFYYLVLVVAAICLFISYRIYHSRLGLVWNAIRDDEIAANCYGINLSTGKITAFLLGSFWGGIAGSIYAHMNGYISPNNFEFFTSVMLVSMVILGGMGNVLGVTTGAVLLTILPEKFRIFSDYRLFIFGLIIVIMLIYRPEGLFPAKQREYEKWIPEEFKTRGLKGLSGFKGEGG